MKSEINKSWEPVYRNPFIIPITLVVRCKIYHTIFTCLVFATSIYYYLEGSVQATQVAYMGIALSIVLLILFGYSILYQRVIGIAYLSKDSKLVRLAHLDFWGKRIHSDISINNIVPLSDVNLKLNTFHLKVARYDSRQVYYMNLGPKAVLNPENFTLIFGYQPHSSYIDGDHVGKNVKEEKKDTANESEYQVESNKKTSET